MSRKFILTVFSIFYLAISYSQYTAKSKGYAAYNTKNTVYITDDNYCSHCNLQIEIGEDLWSSDFTIGFTNSIYSADVVISNKSSSDFDYAFVNSYSNAECRIQVSSDMINEDVSIKIVSDEYADILIYSDLGSLNLSHLVSSLLPIINYYVDFSDIIITLPTYIPEKRKLYEVFSQANVVDERNYLDLDEEMKFSLDNGEVWEQLRYKSIIDYRDEPQVIIYSEIVRMNYSDKDIVKKILNDKTANSYYLRAEYVEELVEVRRIN